MDCIDPSVLRGSPDFLCVPDPASADGSQVRLPLLPGVDVMRHVQPSSVYPGFEWRGIECLTKHQEHQNLLNLQLGCGFAGKHAA